MNENEWNSAVNMYNSSMANLTQTVQNLNQLERNDKSAEEQRDWSEKMLDKQNEWSLNMWNKTNEYNSPSAQLQRLKDAGLNPLYYGLDGSSAQAFQSAQALGYERANVGNMPNPVQVGSAVGLASAQAESARKDIELKNAEIDKLKEERTGLELDNEFKDKTMNARAEGVELANSLTKEQMFKIKQEIVESKKRVDKLIEETKSEVERQGLIVAQKTLAQAQEKEIVELLPLKQNLLEAQTQAQKAAASASYAHALYEKGLIDSGYIDKLCDDLDASIKQKNSSAEANEAMKAINAWKLSVRNGSVINLDSIDNLPVHIVAGAFDTLFSFVSACSEAVGGGLSGFFK